MSFPELPNTWLWDTLGNHVSIRQDKIDPQQSPEELFFSIGLEHIQSHTGKLLNVPLAKGREVKSIKNKFYPSDVLYGKLRPNLNKVVLVDREGICSTDILVLICESSLLPNFLQFYLRSALVLSRMEKLAVGGQLPRVNSSDFLKLPLPVPPLEEQQYIVEILQQADELRRLRQDSLEKAEKLASALFLEMFGNLLVNEKKWKTKKLDKLCDLVRGSSPRPQGDSRYFGGNVPRLMVADLTRDGTYVTPQIDSLTEEGAKQSRPMNAGEVVMAVSGAPGLAAILNVDACIHDGFVGFRNLSDEVLPEFFVGVLGAMKVFNKSQAMGAVFLNLKSEQIRAWQIPIPPKNLQKHYVDVFNEVQLQFREIKNAQRCLEKLINQVASAAFVGELTEQWREKYSRVESVRAIRIKHEPVQVISWHTSEFYRKWMFEQLSKQQKEILNYFLNKPNYLTEDKLSDLIDMVDDVTYDQEQKIKRILGQLVTLGLIVKVSVQGKEGDFVTAYRALRKSDDSKSKDSVMLEIW